MADTTTTTIKIDPYSSSTGAGTLSYYARKYGTTVDNLAKINNLTNKDVIQSGANLVVPTFTQPAVVTSEKANTAVTDANKFLDGQKTSASTFINNQNNTPDIRSNNGAADTSTTTTTTTPTKTENPDVAKINSTYDTLATNMKSQVDSLTAGLDTETAAMVQRISDTYVKRIAEQQDVNKRYLESSRVSGYASGRARYASELQDGILSKEEMDGLRRITDLEQERDNLIQQARAARDDKSRAAVLDYQNKLLEINKAKASAVQDLFKNTMDTERLNIDKAKEVRSSIKDRIDTSVKTAESIAGAVVDYIDGANLSKAERDSAIADWADSYGVSEDYLKTAVKNYRIDMSKANPAIVQEYEYMKNNSGYKGSLLDYQRAKKNAITVSNNISSNGKGGTFTFDDARDFDLPESLIGLNDKDVIQQLSVSKAPNWFKESQTKAGHLAPDAGPAELASQWNAFRNSPDILVFRNTVDINKAGKDNAPSSSSAGSYSAF